MKIDNTGVVSELTILLVSLINTGAVFRIILMLIHITHADDEMGAYKKKLKNVIVFVVLANTIIGIATTLLNYIS